MTLIRRRPPLQNYAEEASLTTEIAWALCRCVYMTTPDQQEQDTGGCACQKAGRNLACAAMENAALDMVQTVQAYYERKGAK